MCGDGRTNVESSQSIFHFHIWKKCINCDNCWNQQNTSRFQCGALSGRNAVKCQAQLLQVLCDETVLVLFVLLPSKWPEVEHFWCNLFTKAYVKDSTNILGCGKRYELVQLTRFCLNKVQNKVYMLSKKCTILSFLPKKKKKWWTQPSSEISFQLIHC